MQTEFDPAAVEVTTLPDIPVAAMTHRGDPSGLPETIRRFVAWRKAAGLPPARSDTYNVFHSDPRAGGAEYRLSICAATARPVAPNDAGVVAAVIPGGRVARLVVHGPGEGLESAAAFLFRDWLPGSAEEPRGDPLFCRRVAFFPFVPAHEGVTELMLPLA